MGPGRRAHRAACGPPPTSPSTRRAATPACPCRCSARSRRRPTRDDAEGLRDAVAATATGLLALVGIDGRSAAEPRAHPARHDPAGAPGGRARASTCRRSSRASRSRRSTTRRRRSTWRRSIRAKDRFDLAMAVNNLLASPGFDALAAKASRSTSSALLLQRRRASRASRSSPSRTSTTPSGCSSSRCCCKAVVGWMRRQSGTTQPARDPLHGRDLRLLPAGRRAAVEAAAADAAEAGARVRPRRRAGHAEPGRPRLQGPRQHRHLAGRPAADRARHGARCWTASRARRPAAASTAPRRAPPSPALDKRVFLLHDVHEDGAGRACSRAGRCRTCAAR